MWDAGRRITSLIPSSVKCLIAFSITSLIPVVLPGRCQPCGVACPATRGNLLLVGAVKDGALVAAGKEGGALGS